jgi:excisionase family DNA binding protein
LSQILFIIGAGLIILGRFRLGEIDAEGPQVRAAGFMLTLPLLITLLLSFVVGLMTGGDAAAASGILRFVFLLEIPAMIVCAGTAYILIQRTSSGQHSGVSLRIFTPPASTREDEDEAPAASEISEVSQETREEIQEQAAPEEAPEPAQPEEKPQEIPTPPPERVRGNFPNVMTTAQAAKYLNISEQGVLDLINEGKLAAARINYRYRISRTVLDEFIHNQQTGSQSSTNS